ncbi:MAG: hypothetical protein LBU64_12320, partial [Planctomycetota bacterium]|nr:hypothetical protein [Planctomycetota bacterium]
VNSLLLRADPKASAIRPGRQLSHSSFPDSENFCLDMPFLIAIIASMVPKKDKKLSKNGKRNNMYPIMNAT